MCDRRAHGAAGGQAQPGARAPRWLGTPQSRVRAGGCGRDAALSPCQLPGDARTLRGERRVTHCLRPGTGTLAGADPPPPRPSSCTCKNQTWETPRKDEVPQIREGRTRRDVPAHTPAHVCRGGTAARAQLDPQAWARRQGSGCGAPGRRARSQPGGGPAAGTDLGTRHRSTFFPAPCGRRPPAHHAAPPHSLLQVEGRLPVEALVLRLHVREAREVVGVHEGEVDLWTAVGAGTRCRAGSPGATDPRPPGRPLSAQVTRSASNTPPGANPSPFGSRWGSSA